jgi:hypothetical protein
MKLGAAPLESTKRQFDNGHELSFTVINEDTYIDRVTEPLE